MRNTMIQTITRRALLAASVLLLGILVCVSQVTAQTESPTGAEKSPATSGDGSDDEEPTATAEKSPIRDGHDRPTTYPKIHFGKSSKKADNGDTAAVESKLKTRVYLLDVSAVMSKSITVNDTRETTRLEHMIAQMESSLDYLVNRKDPRMRFNIVTFGAVQDFASGGELKPATAENAKAAKEWLNKFEAKGEADIYSLLKECFEQEPDSATMLVGGMPTKPTGATEAEKAELKKHKNAGEFVIEQVKRWRKSGKTTTLDISGVGLSETERAFYKRLAEAAGGTYLDA